MPRRTKNPQTVSLTETPNITPGDWVFTPGDSGDPSVGMPGYGPTIDVEIPGREGDLCTLAAIYDPIYKALPEEIGTDEEDYDTGERYLKGYPAQNGLLMAGSKKLLHACQTVLRQLYSERNRKMNGVFDQEAQTRIREQTQILEQAIRDAIIFPEE